MKPTTLFGHPLHQSLIVYPLALFSVAVWCDVAFLAASSALAARLAYFFLSAGLLLGVPSAIVGWIDYAHTENKEEKTAELVHAVSNMLLLLCYVGSWRLRIAHPATPNYLALTYAFAGAVALVATTQLAEKLSATLVWDRPRARPFSLPYRRSFSPPFCERRIA